MKKVAFQRYHVICKKCGYEWMATTSSPKRCAGCNNPNPLEPRKKFHRYEIVNQSNSTVKS